MNTYPSLSSLKLLYPNVQAKIVPVPGSNLAHGRIIVNAVDVGFDFSAPTEQEVESNIFRFKHWDSNRKLPLPFEFESTQPVKQLAAEPADVPEDESLHGGTGLIWIKNDQLVQRKKIRPEELASYQANGWTEGKKFADYVNLSKYVRPVPVKAEGPGRGAHFIGVKWLKCVATGEKLRRPAAEAEQLIAAGTHISSGPRAK